MVSYGNKGQSVLTGFEDDPLLGGRMSDDLICLSGGIFGELSLNSLKMEVSEKKYWIKQRISKNLWRQFLFRDSKNWIFT